MEAAPDEATFEARVKALQEEAEAKKKARHSARRVYVIEAIGLDLIKIGTAIDVSSRTRELQIASPVPLRLLGVIPGTVHDEKRIHAMFVEDRRHGEWFTLTPSVREVLVELGFAMEGEIVPMQPSDDNVQLRVLLPFSLYSELVTWAETSFDSLSNLVRYVLREALREHRV